MKKIHPLLITAVLVSSGLFFFSLVRATTAEYLQAVAGYKGIYDKVILRAEDQYKTVVDAADKIEADSLKIVSSQLSSNQITEDEYYSKVANIQTSHKQTIDQAESILTANRRIAYQNYQAQRDYTWSKHVLGKNPILPPPTPLATSTPPTPTPPPPVAPDAGPTGNLNVFVTNNTYDGNLGGLVGANQKCQAEAETKGLNGIWKALIGLSSENYFKFPANQKPTIAQEQAVKVEDLPRQIISGRGGAPGCVGIVTVPAGQTKIFKADSAKWKDWQSMYFVAYISYVNNNFIKSCYASTDVSTWSNCCKIVNGQPQPKVYPDDFSNYSEAFSCSWGGGSAFCNKLPQDIEKDRKQACDDTAKSMVDEANKKLAEISSASPDNYYTSLSDIHLGCMPYSNDGCYSDQYSLKAKIGFQRIPGENDESGLSWALYYGSNSGSTGVNVGDDTSQVKVIIGVRSAGGAGSYPKEYGNYYIAIKNESSISRKIPVSLPGCFSATEKAGLKYMHLSESPPALNEPNIFYKNASFTYSGETPAKLPNLLKKVLVSSPWSGANDAGYLNPSCDNWSTNRVETSKVEIRESETRPGDTDPHTCITPGYDTGCHEYQYTQKCICYWRDVIDISKISGTAGFAGPGSRYTADTCGNKHSLICIQSGSPPPSPPEPNPSPSEGEVYHWGDQLRANFSAGAEKTYVLRVAENANRLQLQVIGTTNETKIQWSWILPDGTVKTPFGAYYIEGSEIFANLGMSNPPAGDHKLILRVINQSTVVIAGTCFWGPNDKWCWEE
ncbi:MAG: hypothetical protein V1845_04190 [bacterium]